MAADSTKDGWKHISKAQESSTRRQRHTAPIRTESQNVPTERLWKESRQSLQMQSSTNVSGWISQIWWSISRIAALQAQSPLHPMNSGTESSLTSRISESSDQPHTSTFQRKSAPSSILTRTRES